MSLTLGSLFTGFGGLDMAIRDALRSFGHDVETAWHCEYEPPKRTPKHGAGATPIGTRLYPQAAARLLEHRYPNVPNLGDVTAIRWGATAEVALMGGGYPCQSQSAAGKREGKDGATWMWPAFFEGIRTMRPRLAIGENVRNHLNMDFCRVLADLQSVGYAVVWTVIAASDVGACHRRERVFWIAWDEAAGEPADLPAYPFAVRSGHEWVTPDLFGGSRLDKMPKAGAAYAGAAPGRFELLHTPTAQLAINGGSQHPEKRKAGGHGPTLADDVEHLLPTCRTTDTNGAGAHGDGAHGDGGLDLRTTVTLLPTPGASDGSGGRVSSEAGGLRPSGAKRQITLPTAVNCLLPTPTATQYGSNQSPSAGAAVRPSLQGVVQQLLPTPTVSDSSGSNPASGHGLTLKDAAREVAALLPTPDAGHGRKQTRTGPLLAGAVELLPTPRASDGTKGGPNQRGSSGDLMLPSAVQPERWGRFAEAVARQESFTRPAPDPTIPGRNGKPRLNPRLPEWMMGLPDGWICDVPGITTSQALKLAGNGVVPQQGTAAIEWLMTRIPAALLHPPRGRVA